jgi:hypothetical protein
MTAISTNCRHIDISCRYDSVGARIVGKTRISRLRVTSLALLRGEYVNVVNAIPGVLASKTAKNMNVNILVIILALVGIGRIVEQVLHRECQCFVKYFLTTPMGMSRGKAQEVLKSLKIGDEVLFAQPAPPGERLFKVQEIRMSGPYVESVRGQNKSGGIGTDVLTEMGLTTNVVKLRINGKLIFP